MAAAAVMPPRAVGESGYDDVPPADESHNVSFLLTLLTMLDFSNPGSVGKEDWERGIAALHAPGLSWEVSWGMLLRRFDLDNNGSVDFGEMHGLAPLDPRLGALLRVVVQTLVRLSERISGAYAGINDTKMKMLRGTINQWKDKLTSSAFLAWRDDVRKTNTRRKEVLANFKFAPCRKCLHAMHKLISSKKAQMSRAANMIRSSEARLMQMVFTSWRDAHQADHSAKQQKMMVRATPPYRHTATWPRATVRSRALPCAPEAHSLLLDARRTPYADVLHGSRGVVAHARRHDMAHVGTLRASRAPILDAMDVPGHGARRPSGEEGGGWPRAEVRLDL